MAVEVTATPSSHVLVGRTVAAAAVGVASGVVEAGAVAASAGVVRVVAGVEAVVVGAVAAVAEISGAVVVVRGTAGEEQAGEERGEILCRRSIWTRNWKRTWLSGKVPLCLGGTV